MIHQFLDKKQITKRKKIIQNVIVFVFFLIFVAVGLLSWSGKLFNFIGRPVWQTENLITRGFYEINYLFRTKATISKENHNLIEEISSLRATMADYQILKNDLDQLKEILGRVSDNDEYILGNILTKPNHSPYDTVIIDVGNDVGIKEGDSVYGDGVIPIGNIGKVYDKTSLVTLYTNPGQKTEGFINGTNSGVELIGRGGGNFEMVIPLELQADKGTIIYLPGNNSEVLATIDEIISEPTDPFKKVLLSSPVNVQSLKWVQVKKD